METAWSNNASLGMMASALIQTNETIRAMAEILTGLQKSDIERTAEIASVTRRVEMLEVKAKRSPDEEEDSPGEKIVFGETHRNAIKFILNTYETPEALQTWFDVIIRTIAARTKYKTYTQALNAAYRAFDKATDDKRIEDKYFDGSKSMSSRIKRISQIDTLRPIIVDVVLRMLDVEIVE